VADSFYILGRLPLVFKDLLQILHTRQLAFMNIWSIREFGTINGLLLAFSVIIVLLILEYLHATFNLVNLLRRRNIAVRWAVYYSIVMAIYSLGVFDNHQFIYFQF
jgi:hypothetical protein